MFMHRAAFRRPKRQSVSGQFAAVSTGYIFIGVLHLEEKDLIAEIGEDYLDYRRDVSAFVPGFGHGQ